MKHLPLFNPVYESYYNDFNSFVITKGYNRGKYCMYPSCVREFLYFIENLQIFNIKDVIAKDIVSYYEYLIQRPNQRKEGGLSDSMVKSHLFSLRLFFDFFN